jgi:altronate hydrolase
MACPIFGTTGQRQTKSELHGYRQNEFVPWQLGAVM